MFLPTFPDVPIGIGVPPVFRKIEDTIGAINDIVALTQDGNDLGNSDAPIWGLFDGQGSPAVEADNVPGFEYGSEYRISDYPVEDGGFETYNKVALPYGIRLKLARGGSDSDRTDFFNALEDVKRSLDLYSVVTPEFTYLDANVVDIAYTRTAMNGVSLVTAELTIEEVRVNATATFTDSKSKSPAGADPVNDGPVQPQPIPVKGPPD